MSADEDIKLTCRQCGQEFTFTKGEQEFYKQQGFATPRRCRQCRTSKQSQPLSQEQLEVTPQKQTEASPLICRQCGTELDKDSAVFCTACLASARLEAELETSKIKKISNEAHSKMMAGETERAKLAEALRQQEQLVAELQQNIDELNLELEKAYQSQNVTAMLQPMLTGLDERLKNVEYAQNKINERMLQLVERVHEMYENTGLLDVLKRGMGQYHRQGT